MTEKQLTANFVKAKLELFAESFETEAKNSAQRRTARDFGQFADELIGIIERGELSRGES